MLQFYLQIKDYTFFIRANFIRTTRLKLGKNWDKLKTFLG